MMGRISRRGLRFQSAKDSDARQRCLEREARQVERLFSRFLDRDNAALRTKEEPAAFIDLERSRGSMLVNKQVLPGNSILISGNHMKFRVFFSGFDRQDRLRCRLYINERYVRTKALGKDEALECDENPDARFRVRRCNTFDQTDAATISVWADIPIRKQ